MPEPDAENAGSAGISSPEEVDVRALFEQLRAEVRRGGGLPSPNGDRAPVRLAARMDAERLWPVSADRPFLRRAGWKGAALQPVKVVLRKLMRWYVEPVAQDQRAFNDAVLKLIDDLEDRVVELERRAQRS